MCIRDRVEQDDNFEQLQLMRQFKVESLSELGLDDRSEACAAAGALLEYLAETQKNTLDQIQRPKIHRQNEFMLLDATTRRNLELTETLRGKNRKGSLLWILDRTHTAMGSRMLRQWLAQPLQSRLAIELRLDAVEQISRDLVSKDQVLSLIHISSPSSRVFSSTFIFLSFPFVHSLAKEGVRFNLCYFNLDKLPDPLGGASKIYRFGR